jgi:type IV fimbrial biogenesis protein FimT
MIEIMIAVLIMATLLMIGVPTFRDSMANSNIRGAAGDLGIAFNTARAMALSLRTVVVVKPLGTANDWNDGWMIDFDTVVPVTGATKEKDQEFLPHPGVQVVETGSALTSITFNPSGIVSSQATFTVCDLRPNEVGRVITIDPLGRVDTQPGGC